MEVKRIKKKENTKRPWEEHFFERCGCASTTSSIAAWQNAMTFPEKLDRKEHEKSWKITHVLTYHCTAFRGWRSEQATSPHKTETQRNQVLRMMWFQTSCECWHAWAPAAKHPLLSFNAVYLYKSSPPNLRNLINSVFLYMYALLARMWMINQPNQLSRQRSMGQIDKTIVQKCP